MRQVEKGRWRKIIERGVVYNNAVFKYGFPSGRLGLTRPLAEACQRHDLYKNLSKHTVFEHHNERHLTNPIGGQERSGADLRTATIAE